MRAALQILAALAAGLVLGVALAAAAPRAAGSLAAVLQPLGTLFVNAIRMTVIPLITARLIVSVASPAERDGGLARIGTGTVALFVTVVLLAAATGGVVARAALPFLPVRGGAAWIGPSTVAAAGAGSRSLPDLGQWLIDLVPANPFKAAADGAMLPLVVFALACGAGLRRAPRASRDLVVSAAQGIGDAMVALVQWILRVAPLGVFALAFPLAARVGIGAAGALAFYVALVAVACVAFVLLVLYPAAAVIGRVPWSRLVRGCVPAQAIAFSSRSSLASLPVLVEQGKAMDLPEPVTAFFMPVAAALFRPGSAIGTTIGAFFLAHVYGVDLGPMEAATVVLTAVVTMFGSPGVPSGAVVIIAPILASAGVPAEGIGVLLGVDTLPDMFRTTTNVTANMAGACLLSRFVPRPAGATDRPVAE